MKDADAIVGALRRILAPYEPRLHVTASAPENFHLETAHVATLGKPVYFGGVRRGKSYVSFYLMPIYVCPDLVKRVSPALRKRMQGKSCFNFKQVEPELFAELKTLTKRSFERFRKEGYV